MSPSRRFPAEKNKNVCAPAKAVHVARYAASDLESLPVNRAPPGEIAHGIQLTAIRLNTLLSHASLLRPFSVLRVKMFGNNVEAYYYISYLNLDCYATLKRKRRKKKNAIFKNFNLNATRFLTLNIILRKIVTIGLAALRLFNVVSRNNF